MSWELFQKAYLAADEQTKALIDSDAIAAALDSLVTEGLLTADQFSVLLRLYPLVLLQVYTPEQFVSELTNQQIPNAIAILQKLQATVSNQPHTSTPQTATPQNLDQEIAETQAAINSVPPIRTMAGDITAHQSAAVPPTHDSYTISQATNHIPANSIPVSSNAAPTPHSTASTPPANIHLNQTTPHTPPPPPSAVTPPSNLPVVSQQTESMYTTTQEALLRERSAPITTPTPPPPHTPTQTKQTPIPQPPHQTANHTPPPTLREQQQTAQTTDPDEARWGSQ